MIGVLLFFTYAPLMQVAFHTAAIDLGAWLRIAAVSALSFTIVEVEKWMRFRARRPLHMTEAAIYDTKPYDDQKASPRKDKRLQAGTISAGSAKWVGSLWIASARSSYFNIESVILK
jgi:hypothetical protein